MSSSVHEIWSRVQGSLSVGCNWLRVSFGTNPMPQQATCLTLPGIRATVFLVSFIWGLDYLGWVWSSLWRFVLLLLFFASGHFGGLQKTKLKADI